MELDEIEAIETITAIDVDISIVNIFSRDYNPFIIIDMDYECTTDQRGITTDDRLIHIVSATTVGGRCSWAFKVLAEKKGVHDFAIVINKAIQVEQQRRITNKEPYKRWSNNMRSLIVQLFDWDFDFLDDALENTELFIEKFVTN